MTSRNERTTILRNEVNEQWSLFWFNNILQNLKAENLINSTQNNVIWVDITRNPNTTLELIKIYPNLPWNADIISYSLIKSIDFIKQNPDFPFLNWKILSQNMGISLKDIEDNPEFPWDYNNMSYRTDLTFEFVKKHADKNWNYKTLSERECMWDDINENTHNYCVYSAVYNPRITLEFIERHLELYMEQEWYLNRIAKMKIVTLEFIEKHINIFKSPVGPHTPEITSNPNVTLDFLRKHDFDVVRNWPRTFNFSKCNPNVTPELVKNNPYVFWHWCALTARANFSPIKNPEFPWDWAYYHENPNFTFDAVADDKLSLLNWDVISMHKQLTINQIIKYMNYINWSAFTKNQHITMKFVDDHPEFPWVYENLTMNENCTLEVFNRYKHTIPPPHLIYKLINKPLLSDKEAFIEPEYKRHLAAYRIQQHWNLVRTDPNYALCRKKLNKEYDDYAS